MSQDPDQLFNARVAHNHEKASRALSLVLILEWLLLIVVALVSTPKTWAGLESQTHFHLYLAFLGGAVVNLGAALLGWFLPKALTSRVAITIALIIQVTFLSSIMGGRLDSHYIFFINMAFIAIYRCPSMITVGFVAVAADHLLRNLFIPFSIFGTYEPQWSYFLQHCGWAVLLTSVCYYSARQGRKGQREMARLVCMQQEAKNRASESLVALGERSQELRTSAKQLEGASQSVVHMVEISEKQVSDASRSTDNVSGSMQAIAIASEELRTGLDEIASSTTRASDVTTQAVEHSNRSTTIMNELGNGSQEIGQVIGVITSIAEQTNLLALNATIEAARAGEKGKGFAVVAHEVKELAKQTAEATEEIRGKIQAIQNKTSEAVDSIGQCGEVIDSLSELQACVASAIEEISASTRSISHNASITAEDSKKISDTLGSLLQESHQTAKSAHDAMQSVHQLEELAMALDGAMSDVFTQEPEEG